MVEGEPDVEGGAARERWWWGAALVGLVLVAYSPTFLGRGAGFIWDDPDYVINNANLRGWAGLVRTWTQPRSLPQWYPLVHTTFWVEFQMWGLWARGYHFVNAMVHGAAVVVLWRVLLRLGFSAWAAWLGAAIWGVHPVQVESVAWVTERKNTLSALFYFSAGLALLQWRQAEDGPQECGPYKRWRWYGVASALFLMALMSKTVTASLPAAWLVVQWWKEGRIGRRDVVAMLPWFLVGGVFAALTAHLERQHVGASGVDWPWTFGERCLIAGRAAWFYLGKLIWPAGLSFMYEWVPPRREAVMDWVRVVGVLAGVAGLWVARKKIGRGAMAAGLLFLGTVLPALGFVNVYPHRYSFVADHFQYLACVAVLAGAAWWVSRFHRAAGAALVLMLAALSVSRTFVFRDEVALWTDATVKAPGSSIAWANLAKAYRELGVQPGNEAEAAERNLRLLQRAYEVRSSPGVHADAALTLGFAKEDAGDLAGAERLYTEAVETNPAEAQGWVYRAKLRMRQGDLEGARRDLEEARRLTPNMPETVGAVAELLSRLGDLKGAAEAYRRAVGAKPERADWQLAFARVLWRRMQESEGEERRKLATEAAVRFVVAMEQRPGDARVRLEAGLAALELGRRERGEQLIREAMGMDVSLRAEGENALSRRGPQ